MRLFARLTWTEAKLFARDPLAVVFTFAFPFFVLFVLAGVFGNDVEAEGSEDFEIWRGVRPETGPVLAALRAEMAAGR